MITYTTTVPVFAYNRVEGPIFSRKESKIRQPQVNMARVKILLPRVYHADSLSVTVNVIKCVYGLFV